MSEQDQNVAPAVEIEALRSSPIVVVAHEGWDTIERWEFLVALVAYVAALLFSESVVAERYADDVQRVTTWVFFGGLAFVFAFIAPYKVIAARSARLLALLSVPDVEVRPGPSVSGSHGPLVRLWIVNNSSGSHVLASKVMATESIPPGPEPPWHVPWRHSRHRDHRLHPHDEEMIQIGELTDTGMRFWVSEYDGEPAVPDHLGLLPDGEGVVTVDVFHVATGRRVKRVLVTLRSVGARTRIEVAEAALPAA